MRRQLKAAKCNADSLPVIINVLAKWKNFFASNKELVMTEKRQQGLYGELLFLSECLDSYGLESVSHWAGSEDETHDFYFGSHAVEVKTTSMQAPYFASISSEYQMDNSDLPGKLFLRFMHFVQAKAEERHFRNGLQCFAAGYMRIYLSYRSLMKN